LQCISKLWRRVCENAIYNSLGLSIYRKLRFWILNPEAASLRQHLAAMRVFRCLVAATALMLPVLEARLHGLGSERALVVVENNEAAHAPDACSGAECDRRELTAKAREAPQDKPPEFVPTHEWQDIQPNQPIPPVRAPLGLLSGCPGK